MSEDLSKQIINYLNNNPGSKARLIASNLSVDKAEVNKLLYNELCNKCWQDDNYKWYLKSQQRVQNNNKNIMTKKMEEEGDQQSKITPFAKEITKYLLEFLETDFKKRRTPKRSLKLRDSDNLKLGLNLGQYPEFAEEISKSIKRGFGNKIKIKKGSYEKEISEDLFNLIEIDIEEEVNEKRVERIIKRIENIILKAAKRRVEDPEDFIKDILDKTQNIIKRELIDDLVQQIKKSIKKKEGGATVYAMKEDLSEIVFNQVKEEVRKLTIEKIASDNDVNIQKRMNGLFSVPALREEFISFFDNFKVNDLFAEIYELKNNQQIKEKIEFYLYFFDISFEGKTYPLFYIPVTVNEEKSSGQRFFDVDFLDKVYVNKKAVEYITESFNKKKEGVSGSIQSIKNRIIYLNEESLKNKAQSILDELVSYFKLKNDLTLSDKGRESKGDLVTIKANYHIALFDKADENLVNDYESLLQLLGEKESIGEKFEELIGNFIEKEPEKVISEIDDEWEGKEINEKLVARSPIPLNEEQRKILQALNKKDCNYLLVEGPPGTGKSHTITSIVFEAIQKDLSVLVLSDKKEALDVVEDKITTTLEKVRTGKNFQNPILRIGKKKKNLGKIFAKSTIKKIRTNYRAIKKDGGVSGDLNKNVKTLKKLISNQVESSKNIDLDKVIEIVEIEKNINNLISLFPDFVELNKTDKEKGSLTDLHELKGVFENLQALKERGYFFDIIFSNYDDDLSDISLSDIEKGISNLNLIQEEIKNVASVFPSALKVADIIGEISQEKFSKLNNILTEVSELKSKVTFKINPFKSKKVNSLNKEFKKILPQTDLDIFKHFDEINEWMEALEYYREHINFNSASISFFTYTLSSEGREQINKMKELRKQIDFIVDLSEKYPKSFNGLNIDLNNFETLLNNKLLDVSEGELDLLAKYISITSNLELEDLEEINYLDEINKIQELSTLQMSYLMDRKLIDFYDNNSSTAKTLQKIIKKGKRFPAKNFDKMKNAFPCILAEIRDYSEYIPMTPDLFDLVVIDEASQVSIAQAFPALIRGKKVVIFGDKKQFGNVKSSQAKKETNNSYKNSIRNKFIETIGSEPDKLERLNYLDVKNSILDLFEFINNYEIQLSKYFRGYKEIISFSNKYFYNNSLQVMKIRERPIQEVIKFTEVAHDGMLEQYKNVNFPEIEKIIDKLTEFKEKGKKMSVGVITPFRNQQKFLNQEIREHKYSDYFFEDLDLKIMTFDSCQGEERDVIFYSMVANHEEDKLWSIFPSKIDKNNVRDSLRLQRMNVGFSRAKETIHFILSKQVEDLSCAAAREALKHYRNELERAKEEKGVSDVDEKSEMEPKVLHWFYQTDFYRKNKDNIELKPQFELGQYLKQIDPEYNHPKYVVDFLMVFSKKDGKKDKVIIEYDGLKEHFENLEDINEFNYQNHYKEEDIYRQKALEGYGYKFVRFNKFNLKDKPVERINKTLKKVIAKNKNPNKKIKKIKERVEGLSNGSYKTCSECGEVKLKKEFKDRSLKTGYGRKCRDCKDLGKVSKSKKEKPECPVCGLKMVVRRGSHGKFYGCTNFPFCKGTRKYK